MSRSNPSTFRVLPDKVVEGDSGWVLQGVLSRASFRRQPSSDQKTFTVMSRQETWHRKEADPYDSCSDARRKGGFGGLPSSTELRGDESSATILKSLKRPLLTALCRCLPAPHRCGVLEQFQVSGLTFVDSSNLLILMDNGKFVSTAHSPSTTKLLVSARLTRVAITRPGSTLILSNGAAKQSHRERHDRKVLLKERSAPYHHGKQKGHISGVMSDHSLSS